MSNEGTSSSPADDPLPGANGYQGLHHRPAPCGKAAAQRPVYFAFSADMAGAVLCGVLVVRTPFSLRPSVWHSAQSHAALSYQRPLWRLDAPFMRWLKLTSGQRLRRGDQWRNGSKRWVRVAEYNVGETIPHEPRHVGRFRRRAYAAR